ncbi:MAG: translation elongation factor-like protein [Candidatus Thermoplasmatota archaeon]
MEEIVQIGRVAHYYTKIGVAVVEITDSYLSIGDEIIIRGPTTDLRQKIESMEIEKKKIERAEKGNSIGLKVASKVRENDIVLKIVTS